MIFPFHRGWLVAARILAYHHIIEDSLFETSFHEYTSGKPCQNPEKTSRPCADGPIEGQTGQGMHFEHQAFL